jgi:hypothetical protein
MTERTSSQTTGPGAPGAGTAAAARMAGTGERRRLRHRAAGRPARWLAVSLAALGVLAASAAVVSFPAQYQMVRAAKSGVAVPALEAGITRAAPPAPRGQPPAGRDRARQARQPAPPGTGI